VVPPCADAATTARRRSSSKWVCSIEAVRRQAGHHWMVTRVERVVGTGPGYR
jgi:hypothetical protein